MTVGATRRSPMVYHHKIIKPAIKYANMQSTLMGNAKLHPSYRLIFVPRVILHLFYSVVAMQWRL